MSARWRRWLGAGALAVTAAAALAGGPARSPSITPTEHVRGEEQTFLTFPEWFLVHSPAEYAAYVQTQVPTDFPFWGHIAQLWRSYAAVTRETRRDPFNAGYHVMILVIATSTTVEYALRSAYETVIGRLSAATMRHGLTDEDRHGARIAQDYVDFIRVQPWYEYDFVRALKGLWAQPLWGSDPLRKWERRYALTTEYGVKAAYGWLIRKATKASYDEPLPVTAVVVDTLPAEAAAALPALKTLLQVGEGPALVTVPRYAAFKAHAMTLAKAGATFREVAGNGAEARILLSLLVPAEWAPQALPARVLFEHPILTRPGRKRVGVVVKVGELARVLNAVGAQRGGEVEHVYDY